MNTMMNMVEEIKNNKNGNSTKKSTGKTTQIPSSSLEIKNNKNGNSIKNSTRNTTQIPSPSLEIKNNKNGNSTKKSTRNTIQIPSTKNSTINTTQILSPSLEIKNNKNRNLTKKSTINTTQIPSSFLIDLCDSICQCLSNPTITTYLKILEIDPVKLIDITSPDFKREFKKMVKAFLFHKTISSKIYTYLTTKISKIHYLKKYSEEQIAYITCPYIDDSKLIACAGSGKTRSIIARIRFMVEHGLANKSNIFAITFSKHAAIDFINKIINLFPDFHNFCEPKNFSTIDALARSILYVAKSDKSGSVEILSIALRNHLKDIQRDELEKLVHNKNIKYLFVDEAQDLNEVQYDIIMLFKKHLGTKIYLVGDPNQNIYQFRDRPMHI